MLGNCANGIAPSASRPASEMTTEMTRARRGRRMKTEEITSSPGGLGRDRARNLRRDGHPGANALLALNDDVLPLRDALLDDHEAFANRTQTNPSLFDAIVLADDEDVRSGLVDGHRRVRNDNHLVAGFLLDHDANGLALDQGGLRIGEDRAHDL